MTEPAAPLTDGRITLEAAAERLRAGGLVAIPTETVYGLAADARNPDALRAVFARKGRPLANPLIVHLPDADAAGDWATEVPAPIRGLMDAFWPGPLTIVLPARDDVPALVTAGTGNVALRVPAHPLARALLERFGGALCAPSANRSGYVSPTRAEHVLADYAHDPVAVLDGGTCPAGIESTIVRPLGERLQVLRPGAISPEALRAHWAGPVEVPARSELAVPGSAPRHYAPRTPVSVLPRAALAAAGPGDAVIARGHAPAVAGAAVHLLPDDPAGYAAGLYDLLRRLDAAGHARLLIEALPEEERWLALANRLQRAAHPESPP